MRKIRLMFVLGAIVLPFLFIGVVSSAPPLPEHPKLSGIVALVFFLRNERDTVHHGEHHGDRAALESTESEVATQHESPRVLSGTRISGRILSLVNAVAPGLVDAVLAHALSTGRLGDLGAVPDRRQ